MVVPFHDQRIDNTAGVAAGQYAPDAKMNFVFADGHAKSHPQIAAVTRYDVGSGWQFDVHWPRFYENASIIGSFYDIE